LKNWIDTFHFYRYSIFFRLITPTLHDTVNIDYCKNFADQYNYGTTCDDSAMQSDIFDGIISLILEYVVFTVQNKILWPHGYCIRKNIELGSCRRTLLHASFPPFFSFLSFTRLFSGHWTLRIPHMTDFTFQVETLRFTRTWKYCQYRSSRMVFRNKPATDHPVALHSIYSKYLLYMLPSGKSTLILLVKDIIYHIYLKMYIYI